MPERRSQIDRGEPVRGRGPTPAAVAVGGAAVLLLVVLVGFGLLRSGDDEPAEVPSLVASPVTATPTVEPTTPTPSPSPTTSSPTPEPSPTGARTPNDADAAAFAEQYRNEQLGGRADSVIVDVDGNGDDEIVFASLASGSVRVDVAVWQGTRYEAVFFDQGGAGDRLDDLVVTDFTGDGLREIVTRQSAGSDGASLSIWGLPPIDEGDAPIPDPADYGRQVAVGGCWDGSHTFGIRGAEIRMGEITATCDGSPLPTAAWPSDVYVWRDGAWQHDRTEGP